MRKPPPYSEEAERGVIGSCLLAPKQCIPICIKHGITKEHFYVPALHSIYHHLIQMAHQNGYDGIDLLTFNQYLKDAKVLDNIGGCIYTERIIDHTPTSAHIEGYIEIVIEKYKLREILNTSHRAIEEVHDGARSSDIIASSASRFINISNASESIVDFHEEHIRRREIAKNIGSDGFPSFSPQVQSVLHSYTPPNNIVIAAKTSNGKTAFALNEVEFMATEYEIPIAYASNDMTEYDLRIRMAGSLGNVNTFKFGGPNWTERDAQKIDAGFDRLKKLPIHFLCKRMTIDELEAFSAMSAAKYGAKILVVDFLQKMGLTGDEYKRDFRRVVSEWSCRICDIGQKYKMATIVLSQFSRLGHKEIGNDTPPRPTLEALKETGEIENNADKAILICKQPGMPEDLFSYKNPIWPMDINIAKHRNGPTGVVPMALFSWHQQFMSREAAADIERQLEGYK